MAHENDMASNTYLRYCSTVRDLFEIWRAVTESRMEGSAAGKVQPIVVTLPPGRGSRRSAHCAFIR
jgi:hypothetical protein